MNILIVDNGSSYIGQLQSWFAGHHCTVVPFQSTNLFESKTNDLIVLSGGHSLAVNNHNQEYGSELALIRSSTQPVIGICLGFELVVHAFGGTLHKLPRKEHSQLKISIIENDQILKGISELEVHENHRWVAQSLSSELVALGSSRDGIEIIKHKTRPIYGFQFHPEVVIDTGLSEQLLANILELAK